MSYDSEWDERPGRRVGRAERIRSASADMRYLLTRAANEQLLKAALGPANYTRALDYLDCIDKNAREMQRRRRKP